MFDTQHFIDSLALSCPSLKVFTSVLEVADHEIVQDRISLRPESLIDRVPARGLRRPEEWRDIFYQWLQQHSSPNSKSPTIVDLGRSYLQYPVYSDGEGFALSFGSILKIRSDLRVLATKSLLNLAEKYSLTIDLAQLIIPNAFFGVHLRTEKDAAMAWPAHDWVYSSYETQSMIYLQQAPRSNSTVIYVASGDMSEVAKLSSDAANINMTVTNKFDLLTGDDREELANLAWDQQALVDFLVMEKASDFAGIGHSSFAWNIALKRHVFAKTEDHLHGPQVLSDELSQIYGRPRSFPEYAACLWP